MSMPIAPLAGFFSIPAKAYEHFTLTHSTAKTLSAVILAICAGVILAALYNFYIRQVPGGVVRLLLSRDALSPEKALSAEELGLLNKPFSLWELMRGITLRRLLAIAPGSAEEEESADNEEAPITAKTRFYIPEDKKERAEIRFNQEGNGVLGLVLTCVLSVVLGFLLLKLIPLALSMMEGIL